MIDSMTTTDTILNRLRTETRPQHEQTETVLYADKLMAGLLVRAEYEHLLVIHYRFHEALETALARHANFFADYDHTTRRKTPWLRADLAQVGLPIPAPMPGLFAGWSGYQLLGALYVAEGSTLGGRVIARALSRTPDLVELAATAQFFTGYGDQTGLLWKAFGTYLTEKANGHDNEIIEAAGRSFAIFSQLANG
jgi:heme oxygenase (biliverdin-IX-beta and delta-forming)